MSDLLNIFNNYFKPCKYLSRPSRVRQSPLRLSHPTQSKQSREKSKINKVFPQISKDSFSLVSNSKVIGDLIQMADHCPTTIFKKNQPSTQCLDSEVVLWTQPSLPLLRNLTAIRKCAENATLLSHSRLPTAERESAVTAIKSDLKRSQRIDQNVAYLNLLFSHIYYQ